MAKTLEELRAENPGLAAQLEAEARAAVETKASGAPAALPSAMATTAASTPAASGVESDPVQAERQRIQEIDALAHLYDAETVKAAKYGPTACTAQEMAYRAAQKAAKTGGQFAAAMEADALQSGANEVTSAAGAGGVGGEDTSAGTMLAQAKADAKAFNERKKEVR